MTKICIAGAMGRMGNILLKEAKNRGFEIVGAIEATDNPNNGKSLSELGICDSDVRLMGSERINQAAKKADVYITFTTPKAEVMNLPSVVDLKKRIILGTTGFTESQTRQLRDVISDKVPAVFSPNFSLGINILFKLTQILGSFPPEYDFSISEIHHTGKKDSPSGTAKRLGEIVSALRGYSQSVYGREGISPRKPDELEISALRAGGVPGIHDLIIAGPYELLKIEHIAFSRSVFAQGALYAAEWIIKQDEPRIFTMEDVLGFS
ncbi:4-hydroxy-tetrahydrodipicolinate reductase [Candidatus Bathyarchaeota archaeon]|nr:4-hydroxy-tetrahydrodipicolinate reductase [Candidatus Bathyarchaeota archaeon]